MREKVHGGGMGPLRVTYIGSSHCPRGTTHGALRVRVLPVQPCFSQVPWEKHGCFSSSSALGQLRIGSAPPLPWDNWLLSPDNLRIVSAPPLPWDNCQRQIVKKLKGNNWKKTRQTTRGTRTHFRSPRPVSAPATYWLRNANTFSFPRPVSAPRTPPRI